MTPGFVDAHTHLVFAGNRADEFEMRCSGITYQEIARQGGGIRSTVRRTRDATEDELLAIATKARAMVSTRRHHHDRSEIRLRANRGSRDEDPARGARNRGDHSIALRADLSRRA